MVGDETGIKQTVRLSGGEINDVYYCLTGVRPYLVKLNSRVSGSFFDAERDGLNELRTAGKVNVPAVYGIYENGGDVRGLVLEWISGEKSAGIMEKLGRAVAKLHQVKETHFGYQRDTYIGEMLQTNGWYQDWRQYFSENRLVPQINGAIAKQLLPKSRRSGLEYIIENLERWVPGDVSPALLHGDLWAGNWLTNAEGEPCFIDPSVFYGHHEMELAYTELFGGFSERFYGAYKEVQPLAKEYCERKPLYQLFYLLVHLNVFGEKYGTMIDEVIAGYVPKK
nr:fructosamine kinase family protein [Evansella caseinilytica]